MDSLCRVRNKIMYVLSWRTVFALTQCYFGIYFPRCFATREINTNITLSWALKQFVTRVHTLFSMSLRWPRGHMDGISMISVKFFSHFNTIYCKARSSTQLFGCAVLFSAAPMKRCTYYLCLRQSNVIRLHYVKCTHVCPANSIMFC